MWYLQSSSEVPPNHVGKTTTLLLSAFICPNVRYPIRQSLMTSPLTSLKSLRLANFCSCAVQKRAAASMTANTTKDFRLMYRYLLTTCLLHHGDTEARSFQNRFLRVSVPPC